MLDHRFGNDGVSLHHPQRVSPVGKMGGTFVSCAHSKCCDHACSGGCSQNVVQTPPDRSVKLSVLNQKLALVEPHMRRSNVAGVRWTMGCVGTMFLQEVKDELGMADGDPKHSEELLDGIC